MASKYSQGEYILQNPEKYIGHIVPRYKSSWERTFMAFCDNNKNVLNWAYEGLKIPYRNPFTGKQTVYIPDFLIMYQDRHGRKISELVEIKPKSQSTLAEARSKNDKAAVVLNMAKWAAAKAFCKTHGIVFRILTEDEIFNRMSKRKK